jgi:hypothetical protein
MTNCDIILNEFLQRTQIIRTVFGRWLICFISWFLYALESWQCFFVKFLCMWAYSWTWTTHEKRTFVHIVLPISPIQHGIYPLTMLHFDLQILLAQKKYFIVFFFFNKLSWLFSFHGKYISSKTFSGILLEFHYPYFSWFLIASIGGNTVFLLCPKAQYLLCKIMRLSVDCHVIDNTKSVGQGFMIFPIIFSVFPFFSGVWVLHPSHVILSPPWFFVQHTWIVAYL